MSEKFTASNGVVIAEDERGLTLSTTDWRKGREAMAELFLHERDQELGRWRDPECPNNVIYPSSLLGEEGKPSARVLNETNGLSALCGREDTTQHTSAARYFAAHPLPKPWHDAKPGEVWALTDRVLERERIFVRTNNGFRSISRKNVFLDESRITAGVRIWPEAVES